MWGSVSWFGLGSDLRWARSGPARADLGPGQQQGGCAGAVGSALGEQGTSADRRWRCDFRVLVLDSSKLFLASDLGFTGIPESGFRGLGFGVWIWVSGFRGVWGLVLHRRLRWFARGLLVRRRTTPKGDSPGGGFSPGGGHSTTDVQSKAVDQNQEEKSLPPGQGRCV